MTVRLDEMMAELDPERRRRIENRAAELIAEGMTLRELRKARALTQASVARELGISQDAITRLEKRSDLLRSTSAAEPPVTQAAGKRRPPFRP